MCFKNKFKVDDKTVSYGYLFKITQLLKTTFCQ